MKKTFTLFLILAGFALAAQPAGWLYQQPIEVQNPNAQLVVDYQIKLTINTQAQILAGKMNADGSDIRFGKTCGGSGFYNYWIEEGINTPTTAIWVKIDSLAPGAVKTIFMFYGNLSATAVSSIPLTFNGPFSSTDSVAIVNTGGVTNSQRGYRFQPNQDLLVTHFGKNEPNGSTRYITLFNFSTQAIITQTQVSGPAAQYTYAPSNPLWLASGAQYVLEMFQGPSDGYYFAGPPQSSPHLTYLDMRYCNGCTQNTFPTSSLGGMHYGYPDFWYFVTTTVTVPPTYSLVAPATISGPQGAICAGTSVTLTAAGAASYSWSNGSSSATITDTPSLTTIYSLFANDCSTDAISFTVTVDPAPSVAAAASASAICSGEALLLQASGAGTYSWSTGAGTASLTVSPTLTTIYTVTGTVGSCSASDTVTVIVNAVPGVTATTAASLICAGQSVVLTASGATSYSWSSGATTATIAVSPSGSASYSVTGTTNNCSAEASVSQSVAACVGIGENSREAEKLFRVLPNPNSGEFVLESDIKQAAELEIYSATGQLVYKAEARSGNNYLHLKHLANGVYYISILQKGELLQKTSFIKN